jgi:hypothetical protein
VTRGAYEGVLNIVRFNWPFFAIALPVALLGVAGTLVAPTRLWSLLCAGIALVAGGGTLISLGVSHLIYDRSDLYRFGWLARAVRDRPMREATFCQTGFDECSTILRQLTPETEWTLLDHYNPAQMPEPSIQRARRHAPPSSDYRTATSGAWPLADASTDVVLGMLAVHELRVSEERTAWFAEARRAIRADGSVIVVEHVRDFANALVFGPGALHFHSVATWQREWTRAQLRARDAFRITPWVRVFVLERA